jgi:hypothetical protein
LTFGQSSQYKRCVKYLNLPLCKISYFFEVSKYFCPNLFHSCVFGKFLGKRKGIFFPSWADFAAPAQPTRGSGLLPFPSLPSLLSGPQRPHGPTGSDRSLCAGPACQGAPPNPPLLSRVCAAVTGNPPLLRPIASPSLSPLRQSQRCPRTPPQLPCPLMR